MPPRVPPWRRPRPPRARVAMTEAQKQEARARAEAAGRPYPNLIDNMAVLAKARKPPSG